MKKTITLCDCCNENKDIGEGYEVWLHLDRVADPSGNGYENVGEAVHLCHPCCIRILKLCTNPRKSDFGQLDNAKLLQWIRTNKAR